MNNEYNDYKLIADAFIEGQDSVTFYDGGPVRRCTLTVDGYLRLIKSRIEFQALKELQDDKYRAAIDAAKVRILEREKSNRWWRRIFPYRIIFKMKKSTDET